MLTAPTTSAFPSQPHTTHRNTACVFRFSALTWPHSGHVLLVFCGCTKMSFSPRLAIMRVCQKFEAELVEFDGEDDHVHLLVNYPPKVAISSLVNSLKGVSSRRLRRKYPNILRKMWRGSLWSPSYFAGSCGGAPIEIIRKYIEQQRTPD